MRIPGLFIIAVCIISCHQKPHPKDSVMFYSKAVQDSFRIYTSSLSDKDKHPLIILLDANVYFDPVVAEYKMGKLTQGYPEAIIVGVGYKDFYTLDSLRDRDYTFPIAPPKDSFAISGGGDKFKNFIDNELIPDVKKTYTIDESNITLIGHSLGGYFVLYHMLESINQKKYPITNYIAASPALHYHDYYLLDNFKETDSSLRLYSSMGTREYDPTAAEEKFLVFKKKMETLSINNKVEEYSNFDHMDAALPGFMKGLTFILVEE